MSIIDQAMIINNAHGIDAYIEYVGIGLGRCVIQRWQGFLGEYVVPALDFPMLVVIGGCSAKIKRVDGKDDLSLDHSMPGDVALIPRGKEMRWHVNGEMDVIGITFERSETCDCLQNVYDRILKRLGDLNFVGSFSNQYLYTICNHLSNILEEQDEVAEDYIGTQIKSLELYLVNYLGRLDDGLHSKRKQYSHQVDYAIERLSYAVANKINIEDVAREIRVSHACLTKIFKQEVGITPHQFLLLKRINKAKLLLADTSVDIVNIADECGFSHQSHFTRNFTKEVGVSPLRFRQYAKRKLISC